MRKHCVPLSLLFKVKSTLESVRKDLYSVEFPIFWVSGKEYLVSALFPPMDVWEKLMKKRDHSELIRAKLFLGLEHAGSS